ncbi:hypothetical protein J2X31_002401 [Flavobacterium arsenatis]|uniref:PKD domain-containing protein n=1 Tax=Flavobacterium arsenatis TaxID=1484332 RepID=A0ABU1TRB3_9FLAO|nr:M43 family zinc metalloprotease [Flavobacterium arsenatis]MDR6968378.1 hypothetical protein [Flavobacterium arsenatis]
MLNNQPSSVAGYSPFPLTPSVLDGVVMRYDVFGSNTDCTGCYALLPNYNMGKVLIHELGHYFNLYHTFQGACSGSGSDCETAGDKVCDTPQANGPVASCATPMNTCTANPDMDNLSNFMSYTFDSCKDHFTTGQSERMYASLYELRSKLFSTPNLVNAGACADNLVSSEITADEVFVCANTAIALSAPYTSTTDYSYSWNFGDPASGNNTANTPSASHVYGTAQSGPYVVTLTVTRNSDGIVSTSQINIFVTACQPITGSNSTWFTSRSNLLKFNTGIPKFDPAFPENQDSVYALMNQNDSQGNILFYSNKLNIWNANNQPINLAGQMLTEDSWDGRINSILVLPKTTANSYYVFTNSEATPVQEGNLSDIHGFRFHEVQVTNGIAAMVSQRQPITVPGSAGFSTAAGAAYSGEGIVAIKKSSYPSDNNYWIITSLKKVSNSKRYLTVFSYNGSNINGGLTYVSSFELPLNFLRPTLEASPNGNKLFASSLFTDHSLVLDFNKTDGTIGTPVTLNGLSRIEGAAFSPDSRLLYILSQKRSVFQVNLNSTNLNQSKVKVYTDLDFIEQMQTGPDRKIYIGSYTNRLRVIHNPDILCSQEDYNACNVDPNGPKKAISVPTQYLLLGPGLPNVIDATQENTYPNTTTSISGYITGCHTYKFFPDHTGTSFNWNFGDSASGAANTSTLANPSHTFTIGNLPSYTFVVTLRNASNTILATKTITIANTVAYTIEGSYEVCPQSETPLTNNFVDLQNHESIKWTITSGTGAFEGPDNQSNALVNWSILPGVLTATITNAAGCITTLVKNIAESCEEEICPVNLIFNAVDSTTAIHKVSGTIVTEVNYSVPTGVSIEMLAGESIMLTPNSYINSGAVFTAEIGDCLSYQSRQSEEYGNVSQGETLNYDDVIPEYASTAISIFPNPANSLITIYSPNSDLMSVTIVSLDGKVIFNKSLHKVNETVVNIESFSRGIYIVLTQTADGQKQNSKIIKN